MSWQEELNKKLEEQRAKYQEAINNGEAAVCKRSADAKNGGHATGNIHKKSGHIQSLNDYPRAEGQRSEAGKKGGNTNVETGWINEFQKIGTDKASAKLNAKKLAEIKILYDIMESDKLYRLADLVKIVTHVKDRRLGRLLYDELAIPYILIQKDGNKTFFKKRAI